MYELRSRAGACSAGFADRNLLWQVSWWLLRPASACEFLWGAAVTQLVWVCAVGSVDRPERGVPVAGGLRRVGGFAGPTSIFAIGSFDEDGSARAASSLLRRRLIRLNSGRAARCVQRQYFDRATIATWSFVGIEKCAAT